MTDGPRGAEAEAVAALSVGHGTATRDTAGPRDGGGDSGGGTRESSVGASNENSGGSSSGSASESTSGSSGASTSGNSGGSTDEHSAASTSESSERTRTTVLVRPARPDDVPALAALAARTFPLACPPSTGPDDIAAFIAERLSESAFAAHLADPNHRVLVATTQDVPTEASPTAGDGEAAGDGDGATAGVAGGAAAAGAAATRPDRSCATGPGATLAGYTLLVLGEPYDPDAAVAVTLRPTVELSKCYVDGTHHGLGVAQALMSASLRAARELGAVGAWLGVNQHNLRAQRFYGKSGFAVVGTKHFVVGTRREDDYVMERAL